MEVQARLKNLHISPKKVRLVANLVRGKKVSVALEQLRFVNRGSSVPMAKLLKSAVANAENNFKLVGDNLFVKTIAVDHGVTLKRWMPRAFGRATPVRKRFAHITVVLGELTPSAPHAGKKPKKGDVVELESREKIHEAEVTPLHEKTDEQINPENTHEQGKGIFDKRKIVKRRNKAQS